MRTEAIVVGEDRVVRLESVELPALTETRVRVRTLLSGVSCGTEADCASGRATYLRPPLIMGYQAVGRVVEVGDRVRAVRADDLVFTGGGGLWNQPHLSGGSHARHVVAEEREVVRLSRSNPSLRTTAYATLAAVALEGISRMRIEPGRGMLVLGLGMLGQFVGRLGQLQGLRVAGVTRSAWKRDAARALGFDAVCSPDEREVRAAVETLGLDGVRYAVDLTGNEAAVDLALEQLEPFGEVSLLGYYPGRFAMDLDKCHGKQLTIHNPVGQGRQLPHVVAWIEQGSLDVEPSITRTVRPAEATCFYDDLVRNRSRHLGAVIDWR